jgi:hypothetical protein
MPAESGIQGREGIDTGFRRYDGSLAPTRRPDHTCIGIFYGGNKDTQGSDNYFSEPRALCVLRGANIRHREMPQLELPATGG